MSRDPFLIHGPALISFSGGRTSGYMLRRILDAGLQPDCHVVFADTGKERPETYDFVRECSDRWSVPVQWLKREGGFEGVIAKRKALPNQSMRFCTTELKLKPIWKFGFQQGYSHWLSIIGIRADEPRRVANIRGRKPEKFEDTELPLCDAGVTQADVMSFWGGQPFDLKLQPWESNCDLCFLKGRQKLVRIMRDHPELAGWWIDQEKAVGRTFSKRQSYTQLLQIAQSKRLFEDDELDQAIDCYCGETA